MQRVREKMQRQREKMQRVREKMQRQPEKMLRISQGSSARAGCDSRKTIILTPILHFDCQPIRVAILRPSQQKKAKETGGAALSLPAASHRREYPATAGLRPGIDDVGRGLDGAGDAKAAHWKGGGFEIATKPSKSDRTV